MIMLDRFLFDLEVNAVGRFGRILLNININFMFKLLTLSLDIKAKLVLWLLELVLFHLDVDDRIRLLSGLLLLDIKNGCGLCGRLVVDLDFSLRLLKRLWLDNIDDTLGLSGWLWLLDFDIDLLFGWKRRIWLIYGIDPDNVSVRLRWFRHLRWLRTRWALGTLRTFDDGHWLSIRHIIRLDYLVRYINWIVWWQRNRVVLDNWLGRRRGRRRRRQWHHG